MRIHWVVALLMLCPLVIAERANGSSPSQSSESLQRLRLTVQDSLPADGRKALTDEEMTKRRQRVADKPRDRTARFLWVRALIQSGQWQKAVTAAEAWRKKDAYNLVVVRILGDLYAERGQTQKAQRVYSAVVELLPNDVRAHRALATVLKQNGDLNGAYERLIRAAALKPKDTRIAFELADVAHRMERWAEARSRFTAIVSESNTPPKVRYPAKQRLAQILSRLQKVAQQSSEEALAKSLLEEINALGIKGGLHNDIKVYLTWDTDRTDVDLWVTNPAGQRVSYRKKKGRYGGQLFDDVTDGYGPESFTAGAAVKGTYRVHVNYFGTRRNTFTEARGEVTVVLNEGRANEERHVLPYRLFHPKQTVTVAQIHVQ